MKIGIIGFGHLGQHVAKSISASADLHLIAVWNRSVDWIDRASLPTSFIHKLDDFLPSFSALSLDLVIEVCHPDITVKFAAEILTKCNYMIGSPTALADPDVVSQLEKVMLECRTTCYVPSGALWGAEDIRKMADLNTLLTLTVTMRKHPSAFKLNEPLKQKNDAVKDTAVVLYDGAVRQLCPLAPNNVNTMAVACIAAHTLGFDNVVGKLVSDPGVPDAHVVEVEALGVSGLRVHTIRYNPAIIGAVTGSATFDSFVASLKCKFASKVLIVKGQDYSSVKKHKEVQGGTPAIHYCRRFLICW